VPIKREANKRTGHIGYILLYKLQFNTNVSHIRVFSIFVQF